MEEVPQPAPEAVEPTEDVSTAFIRINWTNQGQGQFANNVLVQSDQSSFHLLFYQILPPLILGVSGKEKKDLLASIKSIEAQPVARIILPIEKLAPLIKALQTQLDANPIAKATGSDEGETE